MASCAATPDYTVPQCGPRKRKTRAFDGIPSFFQSFCAIGHVTSNMGNDSQFDVLLSSMSTAATNVAVSTVAWQRNSRFFCQQGEQRYQNSTEKKESPPTVPVSSVFQRVSRCVRFRRGSPMVLLSSRQTACVGALWVVVGKGGKSGRFIHGLRHCLQGERGAVTLPNQNQFSRVHTAQKLRRLIKE